MLSDLRYALRALRRQPGFAGIAVVTLALGIGVASAIFSVANGVLLSPLPYPDAARLVVVQATTPSQPDAGQAPADYLDLRREATSFEALAAYRPDVLDVSAAGTDPVRLDGAEVTVDFFDTLGVRAETGRAFSARTDRPEGERLLVLSHAAWQQHYGGDPSIVGRRIRVGGRPFTVVGVMPARFAWPSSRTQAWTLAPGPVPSPPLDVSGDLLANRDVHYFQVVARLKAGVPIAQADAEVAAIAARLAAAYPSSTGARGLRVEPLREAIVGDVRPIVLVLLGAVGLVLLIGCANVAGLLLARAAGREREIAVRAALGAQRGRLVRQLLTESLLLAVLGGAAGLVSCVWLVDAIVRILPQGVPRADAIAVDPRVVAVTVAVSLLTGVVFGLVPALQASRPDLVGGLKEGDRGASRSGTGHLRRALIVGELALTMVLLVGAGLLLESFVRLQDTDPGFRSDAVTAIDLPLPQGRYPDSAAQSAFYARVLDALRSAPGVRRAAVAFPGPFKGDNAHGSFFIEGRPDMGRADRPGAGLAFVSPDYFRTLGIPLEAGRAFDDHDDANAPAVVIVNQALGRRYWPGQDPVGKRLRFDQGDPWMEVVGVVGDTRAMGLGKSPAPVLYVPYRQFSLPLMQLFVGADADAGAVRALVQAKVRALDAELPLGDTRALTDLVAGQTAEPRFRATLLLTFAGLALLLAAVGLYGLIGYTVANRVREIGIRVALGATARQVVAPIVREGLALAGLGVAIGLAASLAVTRVLSAFLFGVSATDPLTFLGVSVLLLGVALVASVVPARRALKVDPVTALRAE